MIAIALGRDIFPVDTHVHRLTRFLGWVPNNATEVTGFFHLDAKIPDEYKYSLHNLLIRHGRSKPILSLIFLTIAKPEK